jgi:transcription elongation factor Elf1
MDSIEHYFACPYCGEEISMVLDLSVRRQTYVEDCEVCCNPIEINYSVEDDTLSRFTAKVLEYDHLRRRIAAAMSHFDSTVWINF